MPDSSNGRAVPGSNSRVLLPQSRTSTLPTAATSAITRNSGIAPSIIRSRSGGTECIRSPHPAATRALTCLAEAAEGVFGKVHHSTLGTRLKGRAQETQTEAMQTIGSMAGDAQWSSRTRSDPMLPRIRCAPASSTAWFEFAGRDTQVRCASSLQGDRHTRKPRGSNSPPRTPDPRRPISIFPARCV